MAVTSCTFPAVTTHVSVPEQGPPQPKSKAGAQPVLGAGVTWTVPSEIPRRSDRQAMPAGSGGNERDARLAAGPCRTTRSVCVKCAVTCMGPLSFTWQSALAAAIALPLLQAGLAVAIGNQGNCLVARKSSGLGIGADGTLRVKSGRVLGRPVAAPLKDTSLFQAV